MYIGRFVVVAPGVGAYRVSSRSFPNRRVVARDAGDTLTVGPTEDADPADNPYVSYNCVRVVDAGDADASSADPSGGSLAVVGNGSHVDPVAEKLATGYPARDALAASLLALDYEKDDYDTPRIAGVVAADAAWIGTVRKDALLVREVEAPTLVATYEMDEPEAFSFDVESSSGPGAVAEAVYDLDFEHAVCAAGVLVDGNGVETGRYNGE